MIPANIQAQIDRLEDKINEYRGELKQIRFNLVERKMYVSVDQLRAWRLRRKILIDCIEEKQKEILKLKS